MNQYETKTNFLRWSDVIKAWLAVYPEPYFFTSPLSSGTTRVSLRPAINAHIKHNYPDVGVDASVLSSAWENSKLVSINPTTWCFCHKNFNPTASPDILTATSISVHSDIHLNYTLTNETLLVPLLTLINAGLISDNSAILHLKLSPELYPKVEQLLDTYPNIGYDADPSNHTIHLL